MPPVGRPARPQRRPARQRPPARGCLLGLVLFLVVAGSLVAAVVGVVVQFTSDGSSGGGSASRMTATTAAAPAPVALGAPLTASTGDGVATLTLVGVRTEPVAPGGFEQPSANGVYLLVDLRLQVQSEFFSVTPFAFRYETADGTSYNGFDGNALTAGFTPPLPSGLLAAGQDVRGLFVVDGPPPAAGSRFVVSDVFGADFGSWTLVGG